MTKKKNNNDSESWVSAKWRPCVGWMYISICMCDFIFFPVFWTSFQGYLHSSLTQWNPITLQSGGLFHMAMGAILGVAAYGRTQEKLAGAVNIAPTNSMVAPRPPQEEFPPK